MLTCFSVLTVLINQGGIMACSSQISSTAFEVKNLFYSFWDFPHSLWFEPRTLWVLWKSVYILKKVSFDIPSKNKNAFLQNLKRQVGNNNHFAVSSSSTSRNWLNRMQVLMDSVKLWRPNERIYETSSRTLSISSIAARYRHFDSQHFTLGSCRLRIIVRTCWLSLSYLLFVVAVFDTSELRI